MGYFVISFRNHYDSHTEPVFFTKDEDMAKKLLDQIEKRRKKGVLNYWTRGTWFYDWEDGPLSEIRNDDDILDYFGWRNML